MAEILHCLYLYGAKPLLQKRAILHRFLFVFFPLPCTLHLHYTIITE